MLNMAEEAVMAEVIGVLIGALQMLAVVILTTVGLATRVIVKAVASLTTTLTMLVGLLQCSHQQEVTPGTTTGKYATLRSSTA